MSIVFTSDLWEKPEGYEPPKIVHDDPDVMRVVRALMDADPDCNGYEYEAKGATQGVLYYEIPYRNTIARYIRLAVAAKTALETTS